MEAKIREIDLSVFREKMAGFERTPGQVIPLLQLGQELFGYVSPGIFHEISLHTGVPMSQIYGVATFYAQFRLTPVGEHIIRICHGTACHVANVKLITDAIEDELKVKNGETTEDGKFTLELVSCLGCCSLAPVIMVDDDTHGRLTPDKARQVIRNYREES